MKERLNLRVDDELLAWARAYAVERKWTLTTVVETALVDLRGLAKAGVPDAPELGKASAPNPPASPRAPDPRWERQKKLNEAKERRR